MKALILNNKVVDISDVEFPVSGEMQWVDCDESVKVGQEYNNGGFSSPSKYSNLTIDEVKQEVIRNIKAEAHIRIVRIYPEWRQRNHMAAVADIHNKELIALKANTTYTLTAEELAIIDTAKTTKAQIFNIRSKSDLLEASLDGMTLEQLEAFDATEDNKWV